MHEYRFSQPHRIFNRNIYVPAPPSHRGNEFDLISFYVPPLSAKNVTDAEPARPTEPADTVTKYYRRVEYYAANGHYTGPVSVACILSRK